MAITFYYGSGSPYAWRAWFGLEYKQVPYELKSLSFTAGDLKTPEYLRINPRGKVPTIVDGEFSLYESPTILEYLEEKYPKSGKPLFPGDVRQRALVRRIVNEADQYLSSANRRILESVLFTKKEEWDATAIARGREALQKELASFEGLLNGEFFAHALSAADFTVYPMIALALRMDIRKPDLNVKGLIGPKTAAWMKRIEALPLFDRTYPPHWKQA